MPEKHISSFARELLKLRQSSQEGATHINVVFLVDIFHETFKNIPRPIVLGMLVHPFNDAGQCFRTNEGRSTIGHYIGVETYGQECLIRRV